MEILIVFYYVCYNNNDNNKSNNYREKGQKNRTFSNDLNARIGSCPPTHLNILFGPCCLYA